MRTGGRRTAYSTPQFECGGGGGGGGGTVFGLVMTEWNFDDAGWGDGWPFGNPEFEVYASAGKFCDPQIYPECLNNNRWHSDLNWPADCASEKWPQSDDHYFNTDSTNVLSTGEVQIMTSSDMNQFILGQKIEIIVHENDDADDCLGGIQELWGYPDVWPNGPFGPRNFQDGGMFGIQLSLNEFPLDVVYVNRLRIERR